MVPRPPRLVPMIRASPLSVNVDRSMAAGTLLIICDAPTAVRTGLASKIWHIASVTSLILPRFPVRTKKNTNVTRRE